MQPHNLYQQQGQFENERPSKQFATRVSGSLITDDIDGKITSFQL